MNKPISKSQESSFNTKVQQQSTHFFDSTYYKSSIENFSPATLPYDNSRTSQNYFLSRSVREVLSDKLTQQLTTLAISNATTVPVLLLCAYKLLMFRWSGERELTIGVKSRIQKQLESNSQSQPSNTTKVNLVRLEIEDKRSFSELLNDVVLAFANSIEITRTQAEDLHNTFSLEQLAHRNTLLDIAFEIDPDIACDCSDREEMTPRLINDKFNQHDILLTVAENKEVIDLAMGYRTDIFEQVTIQRLFERYINLLEQLVDKPKTPIVDFELLIAEEKQILNDWNKTSRDYPIDGCLHHYFEKQVEKSADSVAIEFEQDCLTYAELNSQANKLARFLRAKGVTTESKVGICMERSIDMVVSIYAILKAGGGYVPLDPEYPESRLNFMLDDINAPVILAQRKLHKVLPENQAEVIDLQASWSEIAQLPDHNLESNVSLSNLAYVIYTSGSTGNPKGVMNQHDGIINRLLWMQDEYQLTDKDVVLQKTPYSFDVSVWEFFWPLMVGAKLTIAKPAGHQEVDYLENLIYEKSVTTMHFVPSMLQIFIDHADPAGCSSIRQVFSSGEALPYKLQQQFFKFSNAKLHNLYGPTEAAVDVTYWQCDPEYDKSIVPIGRAVANTKLYVLDPQLKKVPIGSFGELHIAGVQVARGYLNRAELSSEKFIKDPFSNASDARMYKTGDLVRYLNDGQLEYSGRIDFQVKIRGLRIELGEIETKIAEIESIKQCVVIVREDQPGDKKIVAYYQVENDADVNKQELRNQLANSLPSYMIPHVFVQMAEFPLSPNGKIARKILPQPDSSDLEINNDFVAPESRVEIILADIWSDLLGVDKISVYDKFIELGGHSLLALEVALKARELHQIDIDPASLIRDTLEQVAANIEGEDAITRSSQGQRGEIRYQPYYFGPHNELFGIYQPPRGQAKPKGAVLLCSPIYLESLNTHLMYRQLSAKLSESGFHVFRFDYYASGDSLGEDDDAQVDRWLQDIGSAKQELIKQSGIDTISMIGFRYGATLACLGMQGSIDKLILWEPVVCGHRYVEQLLLKYQGTLEELNYIRKNKANPIPNEIIGFSFPEQSRISIEKTKLFQAEKLEQIGKICVITSNKQAEVLQYRSQLEQWVNNIEFVLVDDSVEPIEGYTDLMVYLAGKSLNVVVDKMNEG